MKIRQILLLVLLTLGLSHSAQGQLSQSGGFYGRIGTTDFILTKDSSGQKLTLLRFSNPIEQGEGSISASQSGVFTTDQGRSLTFQISGSTATGTLGGTAFTAQAEVLSGTQSGPSGVYYGIGQNRLNVANETFTAVLGLSSGGKLVLFFTNTGGKFGGVGTRAVNGATTVPLSTGATASFVFNPAGDVAEDISVNITGGVYDFRLFLARTKSSTLVNLSSRGTVSPGQPIFVGLVIAGGDKTVLVRAVGPTLGSFGVASANADPVLTLYQGSTVLGSNDNWSTNTNTADIVTATALAGGFPLSAGTKDAVLLVKLQPGAYTLQATSQGTAAGDVLVEAYEISK